MAARILGAHAMCWTTRNRAILSGALLSLLVGGACAREVTTEPVTPGAVSVSATTLTLYTGATTQATVTAVDTRGRSLAGERVAWTSSAPSIATVNGNGLVTAVSPGTAEVRATVLGMPGNIEVTVIAPVESVSVAGEEATIVRGTTAQLTATPRDAAGAALTGRRVTWISSASTVATVDSTGIVTGVGTGTVTITATSEARSGSWPMTVTTDVVSVSVIPATVTLTQLGATQQLGAGPRNATGAMLTGRTAVWSSRSPNVATVSGSGLVTAAGGGTTMIIAAVDGVLDSAVVTVIPPVATVTVTSSTSSVVRGTTLQLAATARDGAGDELTGRPVSWSSSAPAIATVDSTGLVTGVATGSVTITATSEGRSGSRALNVTTDVATVVVTPESFALTSIGATQQLVTEVRNAAGVVLVGRTVTWSSVNPAVAGVDAGGSVTALGMGSTLIRATVEGVAANAVTTLEASPLAAGGSRTCAVPNSSLTYCWGITYTEFLGNIQITQQRTPATVQGSYPMLSTITGGYAHTCGLSVDGAAYCWGGGSSGQLGDGATTNRAVPFPVVDGFRFGSLTAGASHTCARSLDGTAYCWGSNFHGQLGIGSSGTNLTQPSLVQTTGGLSFVSLTAGYGHTCGLTSTGRAYCWGQNESGQLGDGTATNRLIPSPVAGELRFIRLSAGGAHTCGITKNFAPYCWGNNFHGQLGTGTEFAELAPSAVGGDLDLVSIVAGDNHSCGVSANGTAYCWGRGLSGQLGTPSVANRTTPGIVSGGLNFAFLTLGTEHTCGVAVTAAIFCWGKNDVGQLGLGDLQNRATPTRVVF